MTFFERVYKTKYFFNLGVGQVSFFTGKLPELMAVVYLLEKFGVILSLTGIVLLVVGTFTGLFLLGYTLKRTGLYDTEMYVEANIHPVQKELLSAARKINDHR